MHVKPPDYRPDIDGLRAIAVLAVLAFHAFPALAPGGFVGVDVFFVISGYLISRHILAELATEKFSVRAFYARRVKRIFPALALILIACTAAGWIILTPVEYEALGRPIAGSAAFVANFVFWKEAGYFDAAADTKPLLHIWSLGIEEQFYIVWPFVLALLWRRANRFLGLAILGLLCVSLVYGILLVRHDATAAFYSPLTRFWELALGAGLAYLALANRLNLRIRICQLLSWLGFALILMGIIILQSDDRFPGALALFPTVGAAFVISADGAWLNRNLLASRPLVWVGLISYPLYLWHWPLLSFARIVESETPTAAVRLWLLAVSILLAWLTYRFAERPVRASSGKQARRFVLVLCLAMLLLFAAGVTIRKMDGLKFRVLSRLNGDVSTLVLGEDRGSLLHQCGVPDEQKDLFQFCLSQGEQAPRFAVLGDSKAEALFYGLARETTRHMPGLLIGSVTPPRSGEPANDIRQQTRDRVAFQTIVDNASVRVVVLIVALRSTFPANSVTGFPEGDIGFAAAKWSAIYTQAIRRLEQAGKKVIFVIDNPTLPDPRSCIGGGMTSSPLLNRVLRRKPNPRCTIQYSEHLAGTAGYRQFAAELVRLNPALTVYDPTPLLCDISRNECSTAINGNFLYSYSDHLSDYANSLIAKDLLPMMEKMAF